MLIPISQLSDFSTRTTDTLVGHVEELYFDDRHWTVRYLVVALRIHHVNHHVLVPPHEVIPPPPDGTALLLALTADALLKHPTPGDAEPVTRQHELELHDYFGRPSSWTPSPFRNTAPLPVIPLATAIPALRRATSDHTAHGDSHLESSKAVSAYSLDARDAHLGHVTDLLVDTDAWTIPYLAAVIRAHPYRRSVLIPVKAVAALRWDTRTVRLHACCARVENSPSYDPLRAVDDTLRTRIDRHYHSSPSA